MRPIYEILKGYGTSIRAVSAAVILSFAVSGHNPAFAARANNNLYHNKPQPQTAQSFQESNRRLEAVKKNLSMRIQKSMEYIILLYEGKLDYNDLNHVHIWISIEDAIQFFEGKPNLSLDTMLKKADLVFHPNQSYGSDIAGTIFFMSNKLFTTQDLYFASDAAKFSKYEYTRVEIEKPINSESKNAEKIQLKLPEK